MKKLADLLPFGALFILPLLFYPGVSASSWRSSSDVHALIEFASSLLAGTAGIMVLLHFFTTGRRFFLIIAIGFVLIGAEAFVHALFSFDRIWLETPPTFKLAISSTWLAGNFVLATSFILALSLGEGEILPENRGRTAVAAIIIGLFCATSVTWLIFHAPRLPRFVVLGSTSKQLIELSLALLYFGAFLFHSRAYLKQPNRSPLLWSIIACIIFRVLVHLFVFDARAFYDSRWDAAHLLVFLGYFFPIFGVWGETIKLNQSVQAQVIELGKAMTERSRAEELLRMSQENLLLATEGAKLGVWNWNIVTDELIWSDRCKALFGIRPDEAMSYQRFRDALHPDDREKADLVVKEALDNHKGYDIEYRSLWPDGSIHWLEAKGRGHYDATGRATRMEGVAFDIAGRKQAEAALRESERRHRDLFDQANEGVIIMSLEGELSEVNRAFAEMHGYTVDECKNMDIRRLDVLDERALADRADVVLRVQGGEVVRFEVEHYHKDGHSFPLSVTTSLINLGGQSFYMAYHQDITERKRSEADLRETNRYLEETTTRANAMAAMAEVASDAKSDFLANMSHEIRTPMNGVIGMTGLLLDTELTDEQRRYAEIVRDSGESLMTIINEILDFSKIEAKKLDLETLDFDLTSLLDDFAATLAARTQEKGIELLCAADADVPTLLRGDPGRLRQILNNVAGNALKFTHAGEVAVRVSLVEEKVAAFAGQGSGGGGHPREASAILLRFSVRDTGIGIPQDKIALLFDKFSQVDASTTRQYGGTGLGLAISKQLTELMGGEVGVSSEEGKGSEFWFTARLGTQAEEARVEGTQAEGTRVERLAPADLRGVRALIVDDNATSREILTTRLASWGMRPSDVPDGPGALQALHRARDENDPFRMAVIDMQMPGMDGETLGRTVKADARLADTRMVMLTSLGTRGDANHFESIGFAGYATKPIRHLELQAVLSLALSERGVTEPTPRPIATGHLARETLKQLFAGRTARILLAEDNITNQKVALGILRTLGLKADAVANGAEAVKALETLPYDLVLMDVQMPEMDGLEATRRIRSPHSAVRNHEVPIIAMTAGAMQRDREECLNAGMNDYVSKPVSRPALAEALDKWLPREEVSTTEPPFGEHGDIASREASEPRRSA